jgi:hypothetical protein
MISSLVSPLIAYLGIFVGVLLGHMAFEELVEGKKYFTLASTFAVFLILATIGSFLSVVTGFWYVGLVFGVIALLVFKYSIPRFVVYLLAPFLFFLPTQYVFVSFSLLFLYGLFQGSLLVKKEKKWAFMDVFKKTHIFLIVYVLVAIISLFI